MKKKVAASSGKEIALDELSQVVGGVDLLLDPLAKDSPESFLPDFGNRLPIGTEVSFMGGWGASTGKIATLPIQTDGKYQYGVQTPEGELTFVFEEDLTLA